MFKKLDDETLDKMIHFTKRLMINSFILFGFFLILSMIIPGAKTDGWHPRSEESEIARSLLQSLQSTAAIYVAQQRVPPDVFKDFVVSEEPTNGAKTLTLKNVLKYLSDEPVYDKNTLTFTDSGTATYYLNGTDVTANFEGF